MTTGITINFHYLCTDSKSWEKFPLTIDEYFNLEELEPNDIVDVDSIPIHNDLLDYLPITTKAKIRKIKVELLDNMNQKKITFNQTFWNNQINWNLERKDFDRDSVIYHETIISIVIPSEIASNTQNTYEILRFTHDGNGTDCIYHGYISDNIDGSQDEILISDK